MKINHDERVIEVTCGELQEMYKKYTGIFICFMLRKAYHASVGSKTDETDEPDIAMNSFQVVKQFVDMQPKRFNRFALSHANLGGALLERYRASGDLDSNDRFGERKTRVNLLRSIPADHVFRFEYTMTGGLYD
jgi:hypothetical protein